MKVKRLLAGLGVIFCGSFFASPISATTYSSDVDVKFNFKPNITIDIDHDDIEILDLTPGQQKDSNVVNISIGTNNVAGYTVSASTGNTTYNNTDMTHSNGTNKFTSIAEDASEATLSTDNTWGYSTSADGTTWANFSGLPVYTGTAKEIAKTDGPSTDITKFKIHAKASTSQPAGDYRNVINFTVVANVPPRTIDDVIPTKTMQAMNEGVCDLVEVYDEESQTQLTDTRDGNEYWVAKLKDNHCWMTQNLDLDLSKSMPLTSEETNLTTIDNESDGYYYDGYSQDANTGIISWTPSVSTYYWANSTWNGIGESVSDYYHPRSYDVGDSYQVGTIYNSTTCNFVATPENCTNYFKNSPDTLNGTHGHIGNYYNRSAMVASNDTNKYISSHDDSANNPRNSICPSNWRLPKIASNLNEYSTLIEKYNDDSTSNDTGLFNAPLYFVRGGYFYPNNMMPSDPSYEGYYPSSTMSGSSVYIMYHYSWGITKDTSYSSNYGYTVRCLVDYRTKHTINFDANQGSGNMPPQTLYSGSSENLHTNTFTWEGRAFTGWNTEPDGSGTPYAENALYSAPTSESNSSTTLYAQWKRTGNYVITYNKNDQNATGEMANQNIPYGTTGTINSSSFTKNNSDFYVWNTQADGQGISYVGGQNYPVGSLEDSDGMTLYAIWLDDDNPNKSVITIPTSATGITIQRAYEIAYTTAHKGMYEETASGNGIYKRVDSWGDPAEQYKGYDVRFSMQDMTPNICNSVTVMHDDYRALDIRDNKLYHITKLLDGKCWMTQNLDLNLDSTKTYTHEDTDIGWGTDDPTNTTWTPSYSTLDDSNVNHTNGTISNWYIPHADTYQDSIMADAYEAAQSFDPGNIYAKPVSYSEAYDDCWDNYGDKCNFLKNSELTAKYYSSQMYNDNKEHGHVGNYYGYTAAVARNESDYQQFYDNYDDQPSKSICPAGWRLPHGSKDNLMENDYQILRSLYNNGVDSYLSPLYMNRNGALLYHSKWYAAIYLVGYYGYLLADGRPHNVSPTTLGLIYANTFFSSPDGYGDIHGQNIRCVAR